MKLPIALGVALAALTVAAASAHSSSRHIFIGHGGGGDISLDVNEDGWLTRAEASSAFERIFADLDSNHDGRLDPSDRREFEVRLDGGDVHILEGDDDGRRVRVITRNGADDEAIEREVERAIEEAERHVERAERDAERAEREAERAERHAERAARDAEREAERHSEREVVIIRHGGGASWTSETGDVAPVQPVPPMPPVPPVPPTPMFMMLIANAEEADRNGDGALSLEEFRSQHLRFFDASDANGDGRVRFEAPPEPPEPPTPPTPPEPPRR